ncbi:MAG: MarR family transcriptional regulator [Deltaproteobacteria bacterium]|jgi:DNA-binding MarR family transcriptional regulator|nr:MarR family transcriptional regulator [Deltaproteobacteria bacterium]MBW2537623.1 MarR family transcriptional regulator [Deltaproteobacteria bacterium]
MSDIAAELVRICRHFGVFERAQICCGSVTVPQCLALQQLLDGPSAMTELAAQAGSSLSTTTRLIDGLERKGWVERRRGDDDRRRVDAALTKAGEREAKKLRAQTMALIEEVLARIPRAKHRQVADALGLLRRAMDDARSAGRACCGS